MKGAPFVNRGYTKGEPFYFLSEIVLKGQGVGPWGGASPYKTLLSTQGAKKVSFAACHLGKLKVAFSSLNVF